MQKKIYQWIGNHTPRKLLYWMVIRAWALATTQKYTDKQPGEVTWDMVCNFLEE